MKMAAQKHPKRLIVFAAVLLALTVLACGTTPVQPTATSRPPTRTAERQAGSCLAEIIPGQTSREEAIAALGTPISTKTNEGVEMMLYATNSAGQYHTLVVQNGRVGLVSILLAETNPLAWTTVQAQYGVPTATTYSYFQEGTKTYIYPEKGQAFVALEEMDIVLARECFAPMTLEEFMGSWGKSLPADNPFTR